MNKKTFIISALALTVSSSAMAYEKPVVIEAGSTTAIESHTSVPMSAHPKSPIKMSPNRTIDLTPTFVGMGYVGAQSSSDPATGFSFEAGHRISAVEFGAKYSTMEELKVGAAHDNVSKYEVSMMAPFMRSDDFQLTYGVKYKHTTFEEADAHNDSFFFALQAKGRISDSFVASFGADVEAMGKDITISGEDYSVHDSITYNAGLDYHINDKFVIGGEISYGSEVDKTYMLKASYNF
jgi:hypothetical protein